MDKSLENYQFWMYMHADLKELLKQSFLLIDIFGERIAGSKEDKREFHDYAFIVFPAAKAYEGFLKTLFRDLGFISDEEYYGKRFRVGKALNPSLETHLREKESVYDRLVNFCEGKELADRLWETWKKARNLLFHWFPNDSNVITYEESKERVEAILATMDLAFKECKIDR